jgi:hypothetical protein
MVFWGSPAVKNEKGLFLASDIVLDFYRPPQGWSFGVDIVHGRKRPQRLFGHGKACCIHYGDPILRKRRRVS